MLLIMGHLLLSLCKINSLIGFNRFLGSLSRNSLFLYEIRESLYLWAWEEWRIRE